MPRYRNLFIYTSAEKDFPEFISVHQSTEDGSLAFSVRGRASERNGYFEPGDFATAAIPREEIETFVRSFVEMLRPTYEAR